MQNMGAYAVSPMMLDRPHLPIHGVQVSDSVIPTRPSLVGPDGLIGHVPAGEGDTTGGRPRLPRRDVDSPLTPGESTGSRLKVTCGFILYRS